MNPFKNEYEQFIEILENAKSQINAITNPNIASLRNRLTINVTKDINFLKSQTGAPLTAITASISDQPSSSGVPLKKIMGKVISLPSSQPGINTNRMTNTEYKNYSESNADDLMANELQEGVDEYYDKFLDIETDQILDTLEDMVIRGIGKTAGLPVTDVSPKRVDSKFVNRIKDAITKLNNDMQEQETKKNAAQAGAQTVKAAEKPEI